MLKIMLKKFFLIIAGVGLFWAVPGFGYAQPSWTMTIDLTGAIVPDTHWQFALTGDWTQTAGDPSTTYITATVHPDFGTNELTIEFRAGYKSIEYPKDYKVAIRQGVIIDEAWQPLGGAKLAQIKVELTGAGVGSVFTLQNPLQAESFSQLLKNMIDFVWVISLAVTPLMLLIAGFLFLTAGGRPAQIISAKKMIFWTIIGFVIITLAEGIIAMLKGILGG